MNDDRAHQLYAEQCHVLHVTSEADGPGEPPLLSHVCRLPDGRERVVDWRSSPWEQMTRDDFRRWIRLGYPPRQGVGPLHSKQLEQMERERTAA